MEENIFVEVMTNMYSTNDKFLHYGKTWWRIAICVILLVIFSLNFAMHVFTSRSRSFRMRTNKRTFHKCLEESGDHRLRYQSMRKSSSDSLYLWICVYLLNSSPYVEHEHLDPFCQNRKKQPLEMIYHVLQEVFRIYRLCTFALFE